MKLCFIILILATIVFAGNVEYNRCGGVGTIIGLRIEGCEGSICEMLPGATYPCEADLYTSYAASSLTLRVSGGINGYPVTIIHTVLPNSSVQPGILYTVRFTLTPNDLTVCQNLIRQIQVSHTDSGLVEICAALNATSNCGN